MADSISQWRTIIKSAAMFGCREDGTIVMVSLVFLAVSLGFGALVWDIGRLFNLHTESQAYVDAVALTAAAELDGAPGAIARARQAVLGPGAGETGPGPLVRDTTTLTATGRVDLAIEEPVFLSGLPDDDIADVSGFVTTDSRAARFVVVTARPRTVNFVFMPLLGLFGGSALAEAAIQTVAVAGFTREVCRGPMMMICNPGEVYGNRTFDTAVGTQILMHTKGSGAAWAPGDFGFSDVIETVEDPSLGPSCTGGANGTNHNRCALGLTEPNAACIGATVNIRPGQAGPIMDGLNVRFDLWDGPLAAKSTDPHFRPARNVTKGKVAKKGKCTANALEDPPATAPTVALPRDSCFATSSCSYGNRFGNGVFDAAGYWAVNHGTALPAATTADLDGDGRLNRFELYRHEIGTTIPNKSATGGENGDRACSGAGCPRCSTTGSAPVTTPDRREMVMAVVNCLEQNVSGNQSDVPVIAFARIFLTEPVTGNGLDVDLFGEVLGVIRPGAPDGILHEYPVLYR